MSEMSAGIRSLEMAERQAWHRERAQREHTGQLHESGPRIKLFRRGARRAA